MNTTVSKALLDLEKGLMEVESAKNQVVSVTTESMKLVEAFRNLLVAIQSIDRNFDNYSETIEEEVKNALKKINSYLNSSLERISKFAGDYEIKQKADREEFHASMQELNNDIAFLQAEINGLANKIRLIDLDNLIIDQKNIINSLEDNLINEIKQTDTNLNRELQLMKKNQSRNLAIQIACVVFATIVILIFS